jgi:dihydrofolate reductase
MISIIVAYANHRVIGKNGTIPWHLPSDLRHFKRITSGHTIVIGRKTFESIGYPLPQRRNIVITSNKTFTRPGIEVVHSIDDVLALDSPGDIFIIGGASVYQTFLGITNRLYITEIALEIDGDTFFPEWDRSSFVLTSMQAGVLDEQNTLPHTFFVYERVYKTSTRTTNSLEYVCFPS